MRDYYKKKFFYFPNEKEKKDLFLSLRSKKNLHTRELEGRWQSRFNSSRPKIKLIK